MPISQLEGYEEVERQVGACKGSQFQVIESLMCKLAEDTDSKGYIVELTMSGERGFISYRFTNVQDFKISRLSQIIGFDVDDIQDRQLEAAKYEIYDYEDDAVQFYAEDAEITSYRPLPRSSASEDT